jgi:hypothetical protein
MPTSVAFKALRMAPTLRLQITEATTGAPLRTCPTREHVQLLRACMAIVIPYLFFSPDGARIDYLTEDFVASKEDGIRIYEKGTTRSVSRAGANVPPTDQLTRGGNSSVSFPRLNPPKILPRQIRVTQERARPSNCQKGTKMDS